jgi:uncharacterized membrane protein YphA (DoxX/SURF4 family)
MFGPPRPWGQYAFVVVRLVVAGFWLNSDIPRWTALMAGHRVANGMVRNLFGPGLVVPLTLLFTLFETLGAVALILGFCTRLASVWATVEFAITGTIGLMGGLGGLLKDYGLMAGGLVLLLNGSQLLSVDGLLAKRTAK